MRLIVKQAMFYHQLENRKVICELCPHFCKLKDGQLGLCKVRKNSGGKLYSLVYGKAIAVHVDPIEKKPLFHVAPGSHSFSMATVGCNFSCKFCQNADISQVTHSVNLDLIGQQLSPEELVSMASSNNCSSIAYTYTEPLIWFEYLKDVGQIIRENNLKNVLVSNGYINAKPLQELLPIIDAANIDLKSMQSAFYKKICKGKLEPILDNIRTLHESGIELEITNLVITGLNDSDRDFEILTDFLASVSPRIPLHFSAYYPTYKMNNPPTSPDRLKRAYKIASRKIEFVYLGNVHIPDRSDTFCPRCKERLICRSGYRIEILGLEDGKCTNCGHDTGIIQ